MPLLDRDPRLADQQLFLGPVVRRRTRPPLELLERPHPLHHLAEDGVLAVEPGRRDESEEELAPVGAGSGVRHREEPGLVVLHLGVELAGVLVAGAAGAAAEWIAALRHEAADHAMEGNAIVEAELRQVDRARDVHRRDLRQELHLQAADVRVEVPVVGVRGVEGGLGGLRKVRLPARLLGVDLLLSDEAPHGIDGHVPSLRSRRLRSARGPLGVHGGCGRERDGGEKGDDRARPERPKHRSQHRCASSAGFAILRSLMQTLYFAYGWTLAGRRLQGRVPGARARGRARLRGWRLVADKPGRDGTAKVNIAPDPAGLVWGALWEVAATDLAHLDRHESGYERLPVSVDAGGVALSATTYASRLRGAPGLDGAYKELILEGAREQGLPSEWLAFLAALPER